MDRRGVLSLVCAGLTLGAGCSSMPATGPRTPPTPGERPDDGGGGDSDGGGTSLSVTDLSVAEADDGHLRVLATVTNPSGTERTRTLRVRVTVGETLTERTREVTVPANGEREVQLDFDSIAYDEFAGRGSVNTQLV